MLTISEGELRILALLATGATRQAAARELGTTPRTLRRRTANLLRSLDVGTPIEAVVAAVKHGII